MCVSGVRHEDVDHFQEISKANTIYLSVARRARSQCRAVLHDDVASCMDRLEDIVGVPLEGDMGHGVGDGENVVGPNWEKFKDIARQGAYLPSDLRRLFLDLSELIKKINLEAFLLET